MTNYDILKEYEAHQTPVPSYDELQNMNKAVNECMSANIKLVEENKKLKNLLKEIKGKLHYINTPKNQHNVFGNDFMKRLDDLFKTENEE